MLSLPSTGSVRMIIEFLGHEFVGALAQVQQMEDAMLTSSIISAAGKSGPLPIPEDQRAGGQSAVERLSLRCVAMRLTASAAVGAEAYATLVPNDYMPPNPAVVSASLKAFRTAIMTELSAVTFASVPVEKRQFFCQANPFGDDVALAFQDAAEDIRDAGNALALGLDTAAVFHLMRVAETGLRTLASHCRVKIKKTPLEWADWVTLIEGIRSKKVTPLIQKKRGPKKESEMEFYRGSLGEFEAFKDAFRNKVMHSRVRYDEYQAASIYVHVKAFMNRLAARLVPKSPRSPLPKFSAALSALSPSASLPAASAVLPSLPSRPGA